MAIHRFINRKLYFTNDWLDVLDGLRQTTKKAVDPYIEWFSLNFTSGKNGPTIFNLGLLGLRITWRKDVVDRKS